MSTWSQRVKAARAIVDDERRREVYLELVHEALPGYHLVIAPPAPRDGPVDPSRYRPQPFVNFDFWLEDKEYWPPAGRRGRLGPRTGYSFSASGVGHAVLGPMAVEPYTPIFTRMHADHELYHAMRHVRPGQSRADRETETWLYCFLRYFHRTFGIRKRWKPLVDYFERASPELQDDAVERLVDYYGEQPPQVQKALLALLERRRRDMGDRRLVRRLARIRERVARRAEESE